MNLDFESCSPSLWKVFAAFPMASSSFSGSCNLSKLEGLRVPGQFKSLTSFRVPIHRLQFKVNIYHSRWETSERERGTINNYVWTRDVNRDKISLEGNWPDLLQVFNVWSFLCTTYTRTPKTNQHCHFIPSPGCIIYEKKRKKKRDTQKMEIHHKVQGVSNLAFLFFSPNSW